MNSKFAQRLLLVPVLVLMMAAIPLEDPSPLATPPELSAKEVHGVLRKTLVARGWVINEDKAGEMLATLNVRSHSLQIRFTDGGGKIAMTYVDSQNLDYKVERDGTRKIHRKYPGWMANLSKAVSQAMQLAVLEKAG